MLGLTIEFSLIVAWFLWMHRRQLRDRARARRVPPAQLRLGFDEDAGRET